VALLPSFTNHVPRTTEDDTTLTEIKPLFSVKTLAKYLAVPEDTVLKWRGQGRLPAPDVRIGDRLIRWKYETIAALVAAGKLLN
jgi:excisionase family DNA binding protein